MKSEAEHRSLWRGSYDFCKSPDGVLIVQWCDIKLVTVGTTYNSCEPKSPVRLCSKAENKCIELAEPNTNDIYKFMGSVDRADQMKFFLPMQALGVIMVQKDCFPFY